MKRFLGFFLLLAWLCSACGTPEKKEYAWQQVDTTVKLDENGDLQVSESLTIRFIKGEFTFIERDLPYRNLDTIADIRVSGDDHNYTNSSSDEPYTYTVERTDGVERVHMRFPTSTTGTRTIDLNYLVRGAVRRDYVPSTRPTALAGTSTDRLQHQVVWWSMVFPQRDGPVEKATGKIILPKTVDPSDLIAEAPDASGSVEVDSTGAVVTATNVPAGRELSLRVLFPPMIDNSVSMDYYSSFSDSSNVAPEPPEENFESSNDTLMYLVMGLIVLVSIGYSLYSWLNGYDNGGDDDGSGGYRPSYRRSYHSSSSSHRSSSSRSSGGSSRRSGSSGGGGGRVG